jgi:hypothetical protein
LPLAATVKDTGPPAVCVTLTGCVVKAGAVSAALTVKVATDEVVDVTLFVAMAV